MRLDLILDPFYVLGALWGSLTGSPVCALNPDASFGSMRAVYEPARAPAPRAAAVTAFIGVNVIPMDTERVFTDYTVLIENGRIAALGPADRTAVPAGAVRIDGKGKYLIPGLGEMHEHNPSLIPKDRAFSYLANGVTTIRYIEFASLATKRKISEIPGPHPRVYVPARIESIPTLDSVTARMTAYKAQGYDFLDVPLIPRPLAEQPNETRAAYDSLLTGARRAGLPVAVHVHSASFAQVLALGPSGSSEHLTGYFDTLAAYLGRGPKAGMDVPSAEIQALALATQRAGVWNSPTLNCLEERRSPKHVAIARRIVKALQDAGAGLLLSADADLGSRVSPSSVHGELAALVRAGLSPYQALLAGTRNVAQYFGVLDSSGTVAAGKWADLVLLYGNPLEDIQHTREPAGVMIGGQWLDRAALDRRLLSPPTGPREHPWLVEEMKTSLRLVQDQGPAFQAHLETFARLTDSLTAAKLSGKDGERTAQRLRRQLADELGALRAVLTPEQQAIFDPAARVWIREQARQGDAVRVAGVGGE